jgi:hypothetical protein
MDLDPVDAQEIGEVAREGRRRSYKRLVGITAVLAVAGAGAFFAMRHVDREANAKVELAWSKLSRCLVGDPVSGGELPSVRLRRIQLTAFTMSDPARTDATGVLWPQRCGALAHELSETLRSAGRAPKEEKSLASLAESLAKSLKDTSSANPLTRDYTAAIDALYERAAAEKLSADGTVQAPVPPGAPAAPYTLDSLASVRPLTKSNFSLQGIMIESHASRDINMLVEDKNDTAAPWSVCTIDAKKARCKKLPASVQATKSGLRLLGTTEEGVPPLVYAGNRGTDGVFRSDTGELLDRMYSYGGWVAKDGYAAAVGWDDTKKELRLMRQPPGGPSKTVTFKPDVRLGNAFYSVTLLWNHLVIRGVKKDQRRLFAEDVRKSDRPGESLVDVGGLPEAGLIETGEQEPHISGCRTAEGMAVRVKGYSNEFIGFDIGGTWREPIGSSAQGGFMTCRKAEITITRADARAVSQNRCSTAGCKTAYVELSKLMPTVGEMAPKPNHLQAIDVDGQLLVVWAAGEKGGLRYRLAPIERIAQAPDVVIYDDLIEGSRITNLSTLFGIGLVAREGYAVIVLATKNGVVTLRVTPDGKVAPLPAQHG